MKQLTLFEEIFLQKVLGERLERAKEDLKEVDSFTGYFIKNETIPMLENLLSKFDF